MFMKKAFAAVLATAVLVAGAVEAKYLRVASNTTFPPFEFVNTKTQEITGFEMDLIRAMGKQAGYEVKITNMAFDGIIPAVLSGSVDVGASGFSVTEERKKRVLFTEPFYKSGLTVLVAKGNEDKIQGFKDLDGRKLAVQIGTTAAAKAKDIKDAKVQTFNNAGDAILELANGGCEAVINDKPVTDYILSSRALPRRSCTCPICSPPTTSPWSSPRIVPNSPPNSTRPSRPSRKTANSTSS